MGQPIIPPTPKGTSVAGKTIIITGGNAGLGLEAARQFLVLGCSRMILACRSLSKGQEAVSTLQADPAVKKANPDAQIDGFELDLDDYQSGLRFAQKVTAEVPSLDILLNNGGMTLMRYETSASGHERTMQVNCYTHVLVSLALLPLLQRTAAARGSPTRITFVGSGTQKSQATLKTALPDDVSVLSYFDDPANFSRFRRYADSKLLVSAYTRRLATLAPGEVVVNNLCPGLVQTGLDKNLPGPLKAIMGWVRRSMARTVEEGARTLVFAAAVAGEETNGMFLQQNEIDEWVFLFLSSLQTV
jgi:NAD(P)-dependent dehydrogenase (short-subunit alcohol dehydrogenase family)